MLSGQNKDHALNSSLQHFLSALDVRNTESSRVSRYLSEAATHYPNLPIHYVYFVEIITFQYYNSYSRFILSSFQALMLPNAKPLENHIDQEISILRTAIATKKIFQYINSDGQSLVSFFLGLSPTFDSLFQKISYQNVS